MFARFRNFFAKAKSEKSPEPERERETETKTKTVTTESDNAQANGGFEQTKTEISFKCNTENEENTVNSEEITKPKTFAEEQVAAVEQNSALDEKAELTQITQPNELQSNDNVVHELSTVTLENVSTATEDTLNACGNKNKTGESINTTADEKTVAGDETSAGEVKCAAEAREDTTNNGNGVEAFVSVDEQQIEVNTQTAEVVAKQTETVNAVEESANVLKAGEISAAAEAANGIGQVADEIACVKENAVSLITAKDSHENGAETPIDIANEYILESLVEPISNPSDVFANENVEIASSITVDELATDASSSGGDTQTQSSSPVGTVDSASTADSNTIVIKPTGNNDIACAAISHKLQEIAEVAESLDAAIRDVQQDVEALEVNATNNTEKKREAMRSNSSEVS